MSQSVLPGHGEEFFALVEALRVFRAGLLGDDPSDRALARAAGVSPTTIGDWLRGERFPQDVGKVLVVVRMVREAAGYRRVAIPGGGPAGLLDEDRWRAAYQREAQRRAGVVSGAVEHAKAVWALAGPRVRVGEADPRLLGVHAAISVPGVPDEELPEYVLRDVDAAEHGVRAKVQDAAGQGGFVLLVGGSSVGKTRCAAEAVKALLPDWWLAHPADPGQVAALAAAPPGRVVVWLDELQRYLDGEHGLTGGVVRALLTAPGPVVIIGTLWPARYAAYTMLPAPGGADPRGRERELLDLAQVIRIGSEFSRAEQDRARTAAKRDPRLALALGAAGYGLTQTLAAAPQLVARWEDARAADPYAWAVLTAALDVTRLGGRAPLSAGLLRAAAPGYCTSAQRAEAPDNWFEQALAYATAKLHGAAAALAPAGTDMGQVAGYTVADYLIQHASRERRKARVPSSTWDAFVSHVRDPADAARLADSADRRLLYHYAIALFQRANTHDYRVAERLAELLAGRRDLDGLRARADADDYHAASRLADLLYERGDLDELRARADAGHGWADTRLAELLARRGDVDELRARADAGNNKASQHLAWLLYEREDLDELRARADAGNRDAVDRLAHLLIDRKDVAGMRTLADAGHWWADFRLAELLAERGDLDELRARAHAGNRNAVVQLALLPDDRRDRDEMKQILRALADAETRSAAAELDELRGRADAGDLDAAERLASSLAGRGDLDELRARADAGKHNAAWRLAELLAERGDLDELRARAGTGDYHAALQLANLLARRGDLDELRARADAGDLDAAERLASLLAERGDLDELRARADTGDYHAAERLAGLLAGRGDLDELRARADAGDYHAAWRLTDWLAERGDLDEPVQILRALADAGHGDAGRLAGLLTQQGRDEDANRLRQFGLSPDGSIACE